VTETQTQEFVANYFDHVDLRHKARHACFARVARQISRHPGGTLPEKLSDPNAYLAMDRLMNRPEVTHQSVLAAHYRSTLAKMHAQPGVVLILHDTTVLDYSGKKALSRYAKVISVYCGLFLGVSWSVVKNLLRKHLVVQRNDLSCITQLLPPGPSSRSRVAFSRREVA
jgi:hypothetical protein